MRNYSDLIIHIDKTVFKVNLNFMNKITHATKLQQEKPLYSQTDKHGKAEKYDTIMNE